MDIKEANIKIINLCNKSCKFCYEGHMNEKIMDLNLYKNIIDSNILNDLECVKLSGGEPLLHPQLEEIISYTTQNGIDVEIATNGILLNEKTIECLSKWGVRKICISFGDHIEPELVDLSNEMTNFIMNKKLDVELIGNVLISKKFIQNHVEQFHRLLKSGVKKLMLLPPKLGKNIDWYKRECLDSNDFMKIYKLIDFFEKHFDFILDCSFCHSELFKYIYGIECPAGNKCCSFSCDGMLQACHFLSIQNYTSAEFGRSEENWIEMIERYNNMKSNYKCLP